MANIINRTFRFLSFRIIGRNTTKRALLRLFYAFGYNLLDVAHQEIGINKYGSVSRTGEEYLLQNFLVNRFKNDSLTIFDIGANVGEYSLLVKKIFPQSEIYAFEPNPIAFKYLSEKTLSLNKFHSFCLGLGVGKSTMDIYTYKNDPHSEHASIIKDVMVKLHKSNEIESRQVNIIDLDSFCESKSVTKIHFLKIDTEGYELEVLRGAQRLINNKAIEIIQFEFNEMNVFSKVFLNDFYSILPGYNLYRLDTKKLIPLGNYNPANEIFRYQNIIAILN